MADVFLNRDKDDEGRKAWAKYKQVNPTKAGMLERVHMTQINADATYEIQGDDPKPIEGLPASLTGQQAQAKPVTDSQLRWALIGGSYAERVSAKTKKKSAGPKEAKGKG